MGAIASLFSSPRIIVGLVALLLFASGAHSLRVIIDRAATIARAERDAHWQGEIAKTNAAVAQAEARQAREAMTINQTAADEISRLKNSLAEMETKNAALPNGHHCGLDADRVRLLPR